MKIITEKVLNEALIKMNESKQDKIDLIINDLLGSDLIDKDDFDSVVNETINEELTYKSIFLHAAAALGLLFLGAGIQDIRTQNEIEHRAEQVQDSTVREELENLTIPSNILKIIKESDTEIYDRVLELAMLMHVSNENPPSKKDLYDYIKSNFTHSKKFKEMVELTGVSEDDLSKYITIFVYNIYEQEANYGE